MKETDLIQAEPKKEKVKTDIPTLEKEIYTKYATKLIDDLNKGLGPLRALIKKFSLSAIDRVEHKGDSLDFEFHLVIKPADIRDEIRKKAIAEYLASIKK